MTAAYLLDIQLNSPHVMLLTLVAEVRKIQTDMTNKGEHQTLTTRSIRDQVCPVVTTTSTSTKSISCPGPDMTGV